MGLAVEVSVCDGGKRPFAFTKCCEANEDPIPCRRQILGEPHEGALLGKFHLLRHLLQSNEGGLSKTRSFHRQNLGEPHDFRGSQRISDR